MDTSVSEPQTLSADSPGDINNIWKLRRMYRAQLPVQQLLDRAFSSWGSGLLAPETQLEVVQQAYYGIVEKHRVVRPGSSCRKLTSQEVIDELLAALEAASVRAASSSQDTPAFRTFSLPDPTTLATVSVKETALFTDVGLTTWGAAFYLAEYALSQPSLFEGQMVLELGTGTGLTALWMLHRARPERLLLTDHIPGVLQNLHGFKEDETLQVRSLDWDHQLDLPFQPSITIAADVVYDPPTVRALVKVLAQLLTVAGARACVVSTIRNPPTYALFEQLLSEAHLTVNYVGDVPALFDYNRANIRICWISGIASCITTQLPDVGKSTQ